jgi:hypothetical protein
MFVFGGITFGLKRLISHACDKTINRALNRKIPDVDNFGFDNIPDEEICRNEDIFDDYAEEYEDEDEEFHYHSDDDDDYNECHEHHHDDEFHDYDYDHHDESHYDDAPDEVRDELNEWHGYDD